MTCVKGDGGGLETLMRFGVRVELGKRQLTK